MTGALVLVLLVAQRQDEDAKRLFELASAAYERSEFPEAISLFQRAYEISPRPQIAFSLAQAYRRSGTTDRDPMRAKEALQRARDYYQEYIDRAPTGSRRVHAEQFASQLDQLIALLGRSQAATARTELIVMSNLGSARAAVDGKEVAVMSPIEVTPGMHVVTVEAKGYFPYRYDASIPEGRSITVDAELRPRPSLIRLTAPDGAEVSIDGRLQGMAPFEFPLEVSAGRHFLSVTDRGAAPYAEEIDLDIGEEVIVGVELDATTQRGVSIALLGLGGGLAVGSLAAALLAGSAQRRAVEIEELLDDPMGSLTVEQVVEYNDLIDRRRERTALSVALGAGAVVSAATGLALFVLDHPRAPAPAPSPSTFGVVIDPRGVAIGGAF
jgi:hypothetical protein